MNKLQEFIAALPCGFIRADQMPALIALDRLHPCLVRCGCGRFTCAAQDVAHFIHCVESGGDYVRDVSLPVGSAERAAAWVPEVTERVIAFDSVGRKSHIGDVLPAKVYKPLAHPMSDAVTFRPEDCGGVYDGINTVYSDADSGL